MHSPEQSDYIAIFKGKIDKTGEIKHIRSMIEHKTTLFRARLDTKRLRQAEEVFDTLGLKPSDAINLFLAQVALRKDLPFVVTAQPNRLQTDEQQAKAWNDAFGEY